MVVIFSLLDPDLVKCKADSTGLKILSDFQSGQGEGGKSGG